MRRIAASFVCPTGWSLLIVLPIIVSNASASFAYDLSAGWFNVCAIGDAGATCWGANGLGQSE